MPASLLRASRMTLAFAVAATVAGCGSFDRMSQGLAGAITPYKVEIVQGNFVSREQVAALKPGMSRQQVRDVLGTPLLTDIFHAERWDYVFTLKQQGVMKQERRLAVFFKGEVLERVEGDEMPTEADFVATLDNKRKNAKVPVLEASEESLKAFSAAKKSAPAPATSVAPAAAASYPPLEAPAR